MSVDPDDARDAACEVTASRSVCEAPPREVDPVDFDPPTVSSGAGGGGFGLVLVIILVALLVAALAWLAKAWFDGRSLTSGDDGDGIDDLDEDIDEELAARIIDHETPPERWRRSASEHRDAGRFRDAIRCEYRGLVGDLARAGFVDEIPGRTSGEERAQIADLAPQVAGDFGVAADLFDEAWFNDDEVLATHDQRFVMASTAVLGSVGAR